MTGRTIVRHVLGGFLAFAGLSHLFWALWSTDAWRHRHGRAKMGT